MVRNWMTFSRYQKKICEANLTKVFTVDKEQQWAKGIPGVSCQNNNNSRVFFETPPTLASVKQADLFASLTSGHSTANTTHSMLTEDGTHDRITVF